MDLSPFFRAPLFFALAGDIALFAGLPLRPMASLAFGQRLRRGERSRHLPAAVDERFPNLFQVGVGQHFAGERDPDGQNAALDRLPGKDLALLVKTLHGHYPFQHWLFLRYAGYALLTAYFAAGCLSTGHALLRAILGRVLPVREQLVIAFPLGLLAFFWLTFTAGLFGLLGTVYFGVAPLLMLAAGAWPRTCRARSR